MNAFQSVKVVCDMEVCIYLKLYFKTTSWPLPSVRVFFGGTGFVITASFAFIPIIRT